MRGVMQRWTFRRCFSRSGPHPGSQAGRDRHRSRHRLLQLRRKALPRVPTEALSVGPRGEVLLESDYCDACGLCAEACPVGAVGFYDDQPLFCDLCDGSPSCVEVCPSGALTLKEGLEVSLAAFLDAEGSPSQKRAGYATVQAGPLRQGWKEGRRVDS